MSAIMGRYTKTGDMPSGAELCLECADVFDWHSGSRGEARCDLTLDLRGIHLHRAGRGDLLYPGGTAGRRLDLASPVVQMIRGGKRYARIRRSAPRQG